MRDIKFRTWSKTAQQIISWEELKPKFIKLLDNPEYPYMMFTGLKDRLGVEIYEGDIVRDCEVKWNGVVKWEQYGLGSWRIKNDVTEDMMFDAHCLEVIGNIHENPELLG